MFARRIFRRWIAGTLVFAILFTQIATASYACPLYAAAGEAETASVMPCAEMAGTTMALDAEQPGLCQQHCQFGHTQQAGDAAALLALPAPLLTLLFVLTPAAPTQANSTAADPSRRDAAPPLSVLHCCYRL
jgi:hypothetical protein